MSPINAQTSKIAGAELTQNTELVFSDPNFYRIILGLQPLIEGLLTCPVLFSH